MTQIKIIKTLIATVIVAVAIQFIPYGKEHKNPPSKVEVKWDSPKTKELFNRACKDCHSNYTKWPKYANYAPVSWLITHDVNEGREHFNISNRVKPKTIKEAIEEIKEGDMPPLPYTLMHKEARLSKKEKEALIKGLKNTFLNK